ncbi:MAG: YajD family HNH nuclease [Granulosicoccus sp.]|nr:YajD family HNH nuclease [Granulosicoccus sp.]
MPPTNKDNQTHVDKLVASARADYDTRQKGYRQRALKMFPWICGRCMREFTRENLSELTVHHRDHNHDNNPQDGSNWELLCLYCHDNEHQRLVEHATSNTKDRATTTHNPFADLKDQLNQKKNN